MNDLGDPSKVPALLALLAPGFIILWFRSRVAEGATPDFKQQLFLFALVSAAYYGLVAPLFHISGGVRLPMWAWSIFFYVGVPLVIGIGLGWVTENDWEYAWAEKMGMHFSHRIPTAWDFRFGRLPENTFILVTLKDGQAVAGRMTDGSFAASAKDGRDVYIGELWSAPEGEGGEGEEEGEWTKLEPERGLLICGEDIRFIEFFGD